MKTLVSRATCLRLAALCSVALLTALLVGCQTPGEVISVTESPNCPMCKTVTRTAAIKGLTYRKHICPGCKAVSDLGTWDESRVTVHVCDHCKAAVVACPQCAGK